MSIHRRLERSGYGGHCAAEQARAARSAETRVRAGRSECELRRRRLTAGSILAVTEAAIDRALRAGVAKGTLRRVFLRRVLLDTTLDWLNTGRHEGCSSSRTRSSI